MKTVAEIIDMVEQYGRAKRDSDPDWHGMLADIERAIKEREASILVPLTDGDIAASLASITHEAPVRLPPGWKKFARAIEAAHGITAAPKEQ